MVEETLVSQVEYLSHSMQMNEGQRECLLGVIENIASSVNIAKTLVKNKKRPLTTTELGLCLHDLPKVLDTTLKALSSGSFCPIQLGTTLKISDRNIVGSK